MSSKCNWCRYKYDNGCLNYNRFKDDARLELEEKRFATVCRSKDCNHFQKPTAEDELIIKKSGYKTTKYYNHIVEGQGLDTDDFTLFTHKS